MDDLATNPLFLRYRRFWPTGAGAWTQLFYGHEANDTVLSAAFRIADGTEGTTITVTSVHSDFSAHVSYRITGHHATTDPEGASFAGQVKTNAPDPPNLDPGSWGAEDTLWLVGIGVDKSSTYVASSDPTGTRIRPCSATPANSPPTGCWFTKLKVATSRV